MTAETATAGPAGPAGTSPDARIRAFDLARGLATLFMVLVHVLGHYGSLETWTSPFGLAIILLGGPTGAPVFMFLMGASLAFSRRSTAASIARKGLWLLGLAYLLNVLRGVVPATLGLATGVVTLEEIAPYTPQTLLTLIDVHQMAALALFTIAGLHLVAAGRGGALGAAALGLAAVVGFVAPHLWGITSGIAPLDAFLALLWGTDWNVFFPLFTWIVYPLVGLAYGRMLVASADRHRLIRRAGAVGVVVGLVGLGLIAVFDPSIGLSDYWRHEPPMLLGTVGLVLAWLALADVVVGRVRQGRVMEVLFGWSTRVTSMYCVHWILIAWGVGLVGHRQMDIPTVALSMVVLMVLSDRITVALPFLRGPRSRSPGETERPPALVPAEA